MKKNSPPNYSLSINSEGLSSNIKDLPTNFMFKRHDGEWLSIELEKNHIDNFMSVYEMNNPKTIKEILCQDLKKKKNRETLLESSQANSLLQIEKLEPVELLSLQSSQLIKRLLHLVEKAKSNLKNNCSEKIEKIFSELKSTLCDIKQEGGVDPEYPYQVDFSAVQIKTETNGNGNSPNYIVFDSQPVDLNSNFQYSQPMSNFFLSNLPSVMSEQNLFSIPIQNFENYYSPNSPLTSDQMIKSINLLSPAMVEEIYSNENANLTKQKRRRGGSALDSDLNVFSLANQQSENVVQREPESLASTVNELFDFDRKVNLHAKKFHKVCLNCKKKGNSRNFQLCCENYICQKCIKDNFAKFVEILGKDVTIEADCFACFNNFYFCSFCLILDLKENLSKCDTSLCLSLFHPNCYKCAKLLGSQNLAQIPQEKKVEFYRRFSSSFLKEYSKRSSLVDELDEEENKTVKKINRVALEGTDNKIFLVNLYKINSIQFYKFFNQFFVNELLNNKEFLFPPTVSPQEDLSALDDTNANFCHKHTCFGCFHKIDQITYDTEVSETISICCNNIHIPCGKLENTNVKFNLDKHAHTNNKNNSKSVHIPLLHLKFYREHYMLLKVALKDLIIVVDKSIFNSNLKNINININDLLSGKNKRKEVLKNIPEQVSIININSVSNINNNSKSCLVDFREMNKNYSETITEQSEFITNINSFPLPFEKLSEKESQEMKQFLKKVSITSNLTRLEGKINKIQSKSYPHCDCMKEAIEKFEEGKKNKGLINNYSIYNSKQAFKNFVKSNNIVICGEKCKNRLNRVECSNKNCYASDNLCKNRYKVTAKDLNDNFTIVKTFKPSFGLVSNRKFAEGEFIMEVLGEIIDEDKYLNKVSKSGKEHYWYTKSYNVMINDNGMMKRLFLYYYRRGNLARFINHACKSNAQVQLWEGESAVKNVPRKSKPFKGKVDFKFLIFASEEIGPNEEITLDYTSAFINHDSNQGIIHKFPCKCSEACEESHKHIGEDIIADIKRDITKYDKHFKKIFSKDNFKNPLYVFQISFYKYDLKIMKRSRVFLFRNILITKRNVIQRFFKNEENVKEKPHHQLIKKKLESFIGFPVCSGCKDKIKENVNFCIMCWRNFHINCTSNCNFRDELLCSKCKEEKDKTANKVENGGNGGNNNNNNVKKVILSEKEEKFNSCLEKTVPNKKYLCKIYRTLIKDVHNAYGITTKFQFHTVFYEYDIIGNNNDNIYDFVLVRKFQLKKSKTFKENEEAFIRCFIKENESLFNQLISQIPK